MKKFSVYLSAIAFLLAGCSSEESFVNPGEDQFESASSFITIRMMAAPTSSMGRADNGVYENGTETENTVTRVRFYFFDGEGDPFGVHRNTASDTYDSYIDWYPTQSDVTDTGTPGGNESVTPGQTVEKILTATLGINLAGTEKPAKVLAIINPTNVSLNLPNSSDNQKINGPSLSALRGVVTDYLTGLTNNNFVMSNSVYAQSGTSGMEAVYTTALSEDDFKNSAEEAQGKPVIIYVERVLARLDLGLDPQFMAGATTTDDGPVYLAGKIQVNDSASANATYTDANIYVKLLGWNVTRTTSQSRLVKDVDPTWEDEDIFGTGILWNTDNYHRSFWAINPDPGVNTDFTYRYGNFGKTADVDNDNYNPAQGKSFPTVAGTYEHTYLQENAAPFATPGAAPDSCSQVIIAAQLVNENGQPLTLAEWGYKKYTLDGLKNQLAKALNNLYSVTTTTQDGESKNVYTPIAPNQLTFQYADPMGASSTDKNYWVYAVLTTDAANLSWQIGPGAKGTALEDAAAVNAYIRDVVNHVMIWNGGLTYYYFNIRHLGENDEMSGFNGVVRNHIYRSTITSISGLGVPVYDPDQIIEPETSAPDDFIISAELRILQWRVVSQSYELKWE